MNGIEDPLDFGKESKLARALATGVPAFIRRAQGVEAAVRRLHLRIAAEKTKRLRWTLPLARRLEAARRSGTELADAVLELLDALREHDDSQLRGRSRRAETERRPSARSVARWTDELREKVERFNDRWRSYLHSLPLDEIWTLQDRYNRYYPIERELAMRGVPLMPFQPLERLSRAELFERHPPLPEVP